MSFRLENENNTVVNRMEKIENKKEYLKKYLSGTDKKKKKKKIISSSSTITKSKIIDDDFDLKRLRPIGDNELDIYDMNEDAPQVVGIVDDRPDDIRLMSQFKETKKWKVITREYEDVEIAPIQDHDSDASPKRKPSPEKTHKTKKKSSVDVAASDSKKKLSDSRKNISNDDSDESPPRKSSDQNRKIKRKPDENDSDVSPPRKKNQKQYDSDVSPPRRKNQKQDDSDASPPRKKNQKQYDSDISPPRKKHAKQYDSDVSPPRKQKPQDSDSDLSPRRPRKSNYGRDRSPPGRHRREDVRRRDSEKPGRDDKSSKTLEGKKAGLQNLDEMKKEAAELRRRQQDTLSKLGDDVSGRGAATIVRDRRTGRKKDFREEAKQKREREERDAELQEKYLVWGKGLKQVDDKATKMREEELEMSKPLARYANDVDLEELQKNQEREGDPMLDYFREKRRKEGRGGPVKQLFQGNFMPNRYGIRPGPKWDGVDRSNGYEKKWFEEQNKRRALQDDSYKWSTEDM